MLRCYELGIRSEKELDAHDMGEVFDLLIEQQNDQEEYNYLATNEDIKDFFW